MRRSQKDTAETRAKIIAAASQLFRARGLDATSIADVMSAAGLTVGGFYRHFDSKEALVVEAIETASRETTARQLMSRSGSGGERDLVALLDSYLSDAHRRHSGQGCPVAALCSEVGHEDQPTKKAFTGALERLLCTLGAAMAPDPKGARGRVLFTASAAVGAVVLARATHDESLAAELLAAVRERLLQKSGETPPRRRRREPRY